MRVAILISGRGSNMRRIVEDARLANCPYEIALICSNQQHSDGLHWAKEQNIPTFAFSLKGKDKDLVEEEISIELKRHDVTMVALAGYMRVLGDKFVQQWRGQLINVHPSLLPAYRGLNVHQRALDDGVHFAGCSIHYVVEELDAGPIIAQGIRPVSAEETSCSLAEKLLPLEHELYPRVLRALAHGHVQLDGMKAKIKPEVWNDLRLIQQ
jgi:phosphoribosylglycinamide formyltransferase, formyltetrahydrofolate-dependent